MSGFVLSVLSGCFYVFPWGSFARMSGFFVLYNKCGKVFKPKENFYGKSSYVTKIILYITLLAMSSPLYTKSKMLAVTGKISLGCKENLQHIAESNKAFHCNRLR